MSVDVTIRRQMPAADGASVGFSLDIAFASRSRRIVLFGPSGAGKSLTLRAIAGLLTPDEGRIALNDRILFDRADGIDLVPQQRKVAYLFQDYALFPHLTVAQNIAFGLDKRWWNPLKRKLHPVARHWIDTFELRNVASHYPSEISGGQKQRTALARALASEPDILLLDEPFSALDLALRDRMRKELSALQARLDVPMLVITHDPADVDALGDHVLELRDGRIHGDSARTPRLVDPPAARLLRS
jgi:molybdate transport system ATP-binding protein